MDFSVVSRKKGNSTIIQIHPVSATSSSDDLSADGSFVRWLSEEKSQISTPISRRSLWLSVKQQLTQALELLEEDLSCEDEACTTEQFEDEDIRLELQELCIRLQKNFTTPHETLQSIAQAHHGVTQFTIRLRNTSLLIKVSATMT